MRRLIPLVMTMVLVVAACEDSQSPVDVPTPESTPRIFPEAVNSVLDVNQGLQPYDNVDLFDIWKPSDRSVRLIAQTAKSLSPTTLTATLKPGETVSEEKDVDLPASPPKGDILFIMDATGSMGGAINNAKASAVAIMTAVSVDIPDSNFGVVRLRDYRGYFDSSPTCSYRSTYGGASDDPYTLLQPITGNQSNVVAAINTLFASGGADGPESYLTAFANTYADPAVSWRPGAKRIVVSWGDNRPHLCSDGLNTGLEPGPDGQVNTADDITMAAVQAGLVSNNITLIHLVNNSLASWWNTVLTPGGGSAIQTNGNWTFPGGGTGTLAQDIADLIQSEVSTVNNLTLQMCPGSEAFAGWLQSVVPASRGPINLPADDQLFDIEVGPPVGTADGTYNFEICAIGDGAEFGRQSVEITVVVDETPPDISVLVTGTLGDNDWYTSDINIDWTVNDPDSPWTEVGCADTDVTSDTPGFTSTCEATSDGGTAGPESVTVKRDATDPTITYDGNLGDYDIADDVAITCTADDNLSGVASDDCADISGPAYTFALGDNTFSAMVTDNAGNTGSGETTFSVNVSYDGLCSLVELFVSHHGVANSLCVKLKAAERSEARGRLNARDGSLGAFINEVEAQDGKKVDPVGAPILIAMAEALME